METNRVSKYTTAFGLSLALCSVLNALLVVVKEKSHAVTAAMQKLTGSHWITHSAIVVVIFVLVGLALAQANHGQGPKLAASRLPGIVAAGIVAGGLIIVGFYLLAD